MRWRVISTNAGADEDLFGHYSLSESNAAVILPFSVACGADTEPSANAHTRLDITVQ
jgi:hypothetical protein